MAILPPYFESICSKKKKLDMVWGDSRVVGCMPFIPEHRRQRQADLCEFKAILDHRASSKTGYTATQEYPVIKLVSLNIADKEDY